MTADRPDLIDPAGHLAALVAELKQAHPREASLLAHWENWGFTGVPINRVRALSVWASARGRPWRGYQSASAWFDNLADARRVFPHTREGFYLAWPCW